MAETPTLYVNDRPDGTFTPADCDDPKDAAGAYADEYGLDVGDYVHVILATERPPEEGEPIDDDATCVLDPVRSWEFVVASIVDDAAVMEERGEA